MVYVAELMLLIVNVAMAEYHSYLIKNGENINHPLWGGLYLALLSWLALLFGPILFVCGLFIRKIFFDLSLNLFRKLPLFYVSSRTTSLLDRIHNKIFGTDSRIYMSVYLLILIVLQFFL